MQRILLGRGLVFRTAVTTCRRPPGHTHGAVRLTELHRFTDPAEGFASLAPQRDRGCLDAGHCPDPHNLIRQHFRSLNTDTDRGGPKYLKTLHLVGDRDMGVQVGVAGAAVPVAGLAYQETSSR